MHCPKFISKLQSRGNVLVPVVVIAALIVVGVIALTATRKQTTTQPEPSPSGQQGFVTSDARASSIYAVRTAREVSLGQINIDGTNNVIVTKLPTDIRSINFLNNKEIIYIAGVRSGPGEFGRGTKVVRSKLTGSSVTTETVYSVDTTDDWLIDFLAVSPDKSYIAIWEIKSPPGVVDHSQYAARTSVVKLSDKSKKVITEQPVTVNDKYKPLFFDYANRLYVDGVQQNPYNFYLGIKRFSVTGEDLGTVLTDGEFNTWPKVSADGKYIAYTSFDSSVSHIPAGDLPSTRVSSINPNQVMLMNLTTGEKKLVADSKDLANYDSHLVWSPDNSGFAFTKHKIASFVRLGDRDPVGLYAYSMVSGKVSEVLKTKDVADAKKLLATGYESTTNSIIFGAAGDPGNLSPNISAPTYGSLGRAKDHSVSTLITGSVYDYIATLPKDRNAKFAIDLDERVLAANVKQLKLDTFALPTPPPPRIPDPSIAPGHNPRSECTTQWQQKGYPSYEACEACPLYLYTETPTNVSIKIKNAQVVWSDVPYTDAFYVTAHPDGTLLTMGGDKKRSIAYDYKTMQVPAPRFGIVVAYDKLNSALTTYAQNLGLNGQETADFVTFWMQRLPSRPYYFISHYDQADVVKKLQLEIMPKPDTLLQTIMYFKPLDVPQPALPPIFPEVPERKGFVAVDFSGFIDLH